MAAETEDEVFAVAGAAYAEVEAFIGFVEDLCRGGSGVDGAAEKAIFAFGLLVFSGVEEGFAVGCPGQGTYAFGGIGEELAGF